MVDHHRMAVHGPTNHRVVHDSLGANRFGQLLLMIVQFPLVKIKVARMMIQSWWLLIKLLLLLRQNSLLCYHWLVTFFTWLVNGMWL